MKTEHKYAQVLRWIADGETVEVKRNRGEWVALPGESANCILRNIADGNCVSISEFRLKPRLITVNGREVQAGETVEPAGGTMVFIADPAQDEFHTAIRWRMESCFSRWLERGLVHLTKEAAIAHARAMLNID